MSVAFLSATGLVRRHALALLPKPDLIGAHRALQATGAAPAGSTGIPLNVAAAATGGGRGGSAAALAVAGRPPEDPAKAKARKDYFMAALAREPEQKWNRIRWCASTAEAAQLARQQRKPLFIEMIVGRMGRATSGVC